MIAAGGHGSGIEVIWTMKTCESRVPALRRIRRSAWHLVAFCILFRVGDAIAHAFVPGENPSRSSTSEGRI
jgi:hypothetical protein